MRVLVTWASPHGGTAGIGRMIGEELTSRGFDVVASRAKDVSSPADFDAVIAGGALYANRWPAELRRFLSRNVDILRTLPVWLFSSGPLDDSAENGAIRPPAQIAALTDRIGALDHVTFGGRLEPDVKGFPAAAMARTHSGDWRNGESIREWAADIAAAIPTAEPGVWHEQPGRSFVRWVEYPMVGWSVLLLLLLALAAFASTTVTIVVYSLAAPAVFLMLAPHYFKAPGSREPLPTAILWTAMVLTLNVVASSLIDGLTTALSGVGLWLPLLLIFVTTLVIGFIESTLPWPKDADVRVVSEA